MEQNSPAVGSPVEPPVRPGFDDWHGGRYAGLHLEIARAAWDAANERWRKPVLAMHDAVLDTMASGRPIAHLDSCADELVRLLWPN